MVGHLPDQNGRPSFHHKKVHVHSSILILLEYVLWHTCTVIPTHAIVELVYNNKGNFHCIVSGDFCFEEMRYRLSASLSVNYGHFIWKCVDSCPNRCTSLFYGQCGKVKLHFPRDHVKWLRKKWQQFYGRPTNCAIMFFFCVICNLFCT